MANSPSTQLQDLQRSQSNDWTCEQIAADDAMLDGLLVGFAAEEAQAGNMAKARQILLEWGVEPDGSKRQLRFPFTKYSVFLTLSLMMLTACTSLVPKYDENNPPISQNSMEEAQAVADKDVSLWKTYTNSEAHVSLRYPSKWIVKSMPAEDNHRSERIFGAEGGVYITWGNGLGGACSKNGQETMLESMTLNGEQFDVCHVTESDGTEHWSLLSKKLSETMGVTVSAYAKSPASETRWVIQNILSTLSFK